jgi:predicted ATPase/class 3 adenylate cyclase
MIPGYEIGEVIHRSDSTAIYRAKRLGDGLPVIIKALAGEYPSVQHLAELRHEFQILRRLQHIESVIRVYALESYGNGNVAIVLEPFGQSLAQIIASERRRGLPLKRVLSVAIAIADALGRIHELDIVHKSVEPQNVLIDQDLDTIRLIDFKIASNLSIERHNVASSRQLEGALPYMSPEQTGRMNRDLDYRTDYYSLGVTLFELLTGELPFRADSILSWVHKHISKFPPSPSEFEPSIPEGVAAIVLKLMAKNAEDRYQSSFGLIEDLRRCERELTQTGSVAAFALGHRDFAHKFHIPQRLYCRDLERSALLARFEWVAAGSNELCMVSGHSGVGKSALVNEISSMLARSSGGYLLQGKFDQFQRGKPYSAVAAAFGSLIPQLLVESEERKQALRNELLAAVAPNAQLLIDLVPELELIIGSQTAVPELPPTEAQNRFQIAFLNFVRVVSDPQPLVVFLDDLQFSDAPSLNLMRWLATAREIKHLLVIGAYRSNEVDVGHPLRLALNEIQQTRSIHYLPLAPLDLESVGQLVADTLHVDLASCETLSALLHDRSEGNPLFLIEILKTLEQSRAIAFAPDLGRWRWDMDAIWSTGLSDNVVDFLVAKLRTLPLATQKVLQLAACIGNSFDLRTLSIISEQSMDSAGEDLLPALQRSVIAPMSADYRFVGTAGSGESSGAADVEAFNPIYRFQHDRVQQAAYALIDANRKQEVHLSIGRLIQSHSGLQEREGRLIEIVGHLNNGRRLIENPDDRRDLARLNLAAGMQTQRSGAYEVALGHLRIGQDLLPPNAWESDYDLAIALATGYQQCAYLTTRYSEAESWIHELLARARTNLEKAEILSMRTRQYSTTGKMAESIQAAITGLSLLGMRVTANPNSAAIGREIAGVRRNLADRRIADLIDAPPMTDRTQILQVRLLMEIFAPAFLSASGNLFPFLVLKSVNISLCNGNCPESAFAYAAYGMLLCGSLDDPALGYEFGRLAVTMNDRFDDIALKSRIIYLFAMFIMHWSEHWSSMTPWFRRGIEAGYQSGDLLYLAYSAQDCVIWDPKLDLEAAALEHANLLSIVRDCAYQDSFDSGTLFLQMQRNFLGLTDSLYTMNDGVFDEQHCVDQMRLRGFMTGVSNYHIYKTEIFFFYGAYAEALAHARAQDQLMASVMSLPQLARFTVISFLTMAACLPGMDSTEQGQTRKRMREGLRRMSRWAEHCPLNFLHLGLLMQAEMARVGGRVEPALQLYDKSIDSARRHEFRRDEAMANELAARHLVAVTRRKSAEGYVRAAHSLYERWGARRKVAHLENEFPYLQRAQTRASGGRTATEWPPATKVVVDSASLDMASIIKASQAISSEIVLDQLWTITMRIMLENAGGQRGCFVVRKDDQLVIEGLCEAGEENTSIARSVPFTGAEGANALPISIVYKVLHTNSPIVLHDAARAGEFAKDTYLQARAPRSVLCTPLAHHGKVEGAIYIENSLAAAAFTEDRIEVINLLAAQMAISIENAALYENQRRLIDAQRRFVPSQFLESLARRDLAHVSAGEHVLKEINVMFADLRDFTTLAERLNPRDTIELLNRFFQNMERPISKEGGFIGSFAGDEIMAFFDAAADFAVRAGIMMWRELDEFNRRSAAHGQPILHMGIGVNTGPVVLGTVGGPNRIQCSVVGDTVNLASRIEQLTKVYSGRFLISENTYKGLNNQDAYAIRRVDRVTVKGKIAAVNVYEVIDAETPERRAAKLATGELLELAMEKYFSGEFCAALPLFEQVRAEDCNDSLPALFAERCRRRPGDQPTQGWPGFEKPVAI